MSEEEESEEDEEESELELLALRRAGMECGSALTLAFSTAEEETPSVYRIKLMSSTGHEQRNSP